MSRLSRDPEEVTAAGAPAVAEIPPSTRMGAVHLTVSDLERSIHYYEWAVGLRVHERAGDRSGGRAVLGAGGEDLLVLYEEAGAEPADGFCGLYHFALLVPERSDLARWLHHSALERVPLVGLADHFVSEAIYLSDPDHHGIEIYWDRPREIWEGEVARRLTTEALDVRAMLELLPDAVSEPFRGLPTGTTMGHVHLRVAAIRPTIAFYRDVLGFGLMASLGTRATFLSAGGYHHHIGANTWESAGAPPSPSDHAALREATIVLPDAASLETVAERVAETGQEPQRTPTGILLRDPSGNPLGLVAAT